MEIKRNFIFLLIFLFIMMLLSTSYSGLYSQVNKNDDEISVLLKKAEENYQNGNFKEAIRIYETIIQK